MKRILLVFLIIILSNKLLFSQNKDCLSVDTCISYNRIVKNVTAYHIRYASLFELGVSSVTYKNHKEGFLYGHWIGFMPETNDMILQLQFVKTAFIYPDSTYKVYSFFFHLMVGHLEQLQRLLGELITTEKCNEA